MDINATASAQKKMRRRHACHAFPHSGQHTETKHNSRAYVRPHVG